MVFSGLSPQTLASAVQPWGGPVLLEAVSLCLVPEQVSLLGQIVTRLSVHLAGGEMEKDAPAFFLFSPNPRDFCCQDTREIPAQPETCFLGGYR